jgi:hypothetical protein
MISSLGSWVRIPLDAWMCALILCLCGPLQVAAYTQAGYPYKQSYQLSIILARVIAQAVSIRLRSQVRSCWICDRQIEIGARLLPGLQFPLPILITLKAPHTSTIFRGWFNRPNSGRRVRPLLWSGGQSYWPQIQRSRVPFPALPNILRNGGCGTGSIQPHENK